MELLQPEAGVLFWMTLAFAVVFIVLARYGFPMIVRAIEERKAYIDRSLEEARAAERKLRELDAEGQAVRLPPSASAAGFSAKPPRRATPCWPRRAAGPTRRVRGSSPQPGRRPKANGRRSCRMPVIRWRCSRSPLRRNAARTAGRRGVADAARGEDARRDGEPERTKGGIGYVYRIDSESLRIGAGGVFRGERRRGAAPTTRCGG